MAFDFNSEVIEAPLLWGSAIGYSGARSSRICSLAGHTVDGSEIPDNHRLDV